MCSWIFLQAGSRSRLGHFCPKRDRIDSSVDQLVGAGEEEAGYFDPERLRSLQVEA
jgi:hypothetical protein